MQCQMAIIYMTILEILFNKTFFFIYFPCILFSGYPLKVRLSHAPVQYAGCVEVEYAGIWGDVGMFRWDHEDGRVVCRQLGYQDVLTVMWRCSFKLARVSNVVTWFDNVQCIGNESSLTNCTLERQRYRSSFGYDAGVVCQNKSQTGTYTRMNNYEIYMLSLQQKISSIYAN